MKNLSDIKLGICQWSLPIDGPYACKIAASLGLQGIELNLDADYLNAPLSRDDVQKAYLEAGQEWGITFPTLGVNALCHYGASKASSEKTVRDIFDVAVSIAAAMHIPLLQVPSFGNGSIASEEELLQAAKAFTYGCQRAKEYGIIVGTENALTVKDNLSLLEACGCENLKVYFDTQNPWAMEGYNSADMITELFPHICESHVKDGHERTLSNALLGQGDSSFDATLKALLDQGYKGWLVLENNYHQLAQADGLNPMNLIAKDITYLREFLKREKL